MYAHIFKVYASHVNKSVYGLVIGAETGIPEYMAFLDVFGRQRDNERLEHSHMSTYPCVCIYIYIIMYYADNWMYVHMYTHRFIHG